MKQPTTQQVNAAESLASPDLPGGSALPLMVPSHSEPEPEDVASKARGSATVLDAHAKFAEEIHQYVREYIRNADQKATFFFAAVTAGLAYLVGHGGTGAVFKAPGALTVSDVAGLLGTFGLASSASLLLAVVFPRLRASSPDIVFFNAIAEYRAPEDYARAVIATPAPEVTQIKLRHAYDLARVCRTKYRSLRAGFWAGGVGAVATVLYLAS